MEIQLSQRLRALWSSHRLPWVIIGLGLILRLVQYASNRSLWLDEALLALNIINRSFLELLQPLDYNQGAPIGFLMLEKLAVQAFGTSEYALRLFPLIAGILSLFLFYVVARRYITSTATPIALSLFAISGPLIYYSSEVKQYSTDVAIMLILYSVTIYVTSERIAASRIALFGVVGAIAIWFSHPSVFVLGGIGITLALFCIGKKDYERLARLSPAYLLWAVSFCVFYFVSLRSLSNNQALLNFWAAGFMPFPPSSISDVKWFSDTFFKMFNDPVGLSLKGIAALTFLVGCVSMFAEKKERFALLLSPPLLVLLASALHKYPFRGRLLLFIVPSLLLFIAEGAKEIMDRTRNRLHVVGPLLLCLLFFHPLLSAAHDLIKPRDREAIKPVIRYVKEHKQTGELLYLYHASQYAFKYYSGDGSCYDIDCVMGIASPDNWRNYMEDLNKLRGKERVWILFSHVFRRRGDEQKFFINYLESIGTKLDLFEAPGAAVYLYDLS